MKGGMTVINIEIYNRQIRLDPALRESLLDQRVERTSEFKRAITTQKVQYNPVTDINVDEFILEKMITDFSECAIYNALGELDYWFSFSKGVMIDPGYKALAYRALYGRDKKPDTSAVGAIGEGVAGLIMKRHYKAARITRPNNYPDIIMQNITGDVKMLVEAKASTDDLEHHKQGNWVSEFEQLCYQLLAVEQGTTESFEGYFISTHIKSKNEYASYITQTVMK